MTTPSDDEIAAALTALAAERGDRTFCPSEAARRLAEAWRPLMPRVREVAARLQGTGRLEALQKDRPVDAVTARGPIRLRGPR